MLSDKEESTFDIFRLIIYSHISMTCAQSFLGDIVQRAKLNIKNSIIDTVMFSESCRAS